MIVDIVLRLILFKILIIFLVLVLDENEKIHFKDYLRNDSIGLLRMVIIEILPVKFLQLLILGSLSLTSMLCLKIYLVHECMFSGRLHLFYRVLLDEILILLRRQIHQQRVNLLKLKQVEKFLIHLSQHLKNGDEF